MRRFDWLYLAAALPFFVVALGGAEYGAFWIYFAPALVCAVQFVLPTKLGWGFVTVLYGVSAILCTGILLTDVWRFVRGEPLSVLLDADDSVMFLVMLAFLCFFAVALLSRRRRPQRQTGAHTSPDSRG